MNLRVKKSNIPNGGLGLYADKPGAKEGEIVFRPKEKICDYTGKIVSKEQLDRKYGPGDETVAPYALALGNGDYVDPYKSNHGVGRYANSYHKTRFYQNAKFKTYPRRNKGVGKAVIKAKDPIRQGDEIFVKYGRGYWKPKKPKGTTKRRTTRNSNRAR